LVCKTNGAPQSIAQTTTQSFPFTGGEFNRPRPVPRADVQPVYAPGILEVAYRSSVLGANRAAAARLTEGVRGHVQAEIDADAIGDRIQIVAVEPGTEDQTAEQLRSNPLVKSVSRDAVRYMFSTTPHLLNDPYYLGFPSGVGPPLYETSAANSRGQWDMHVICAANAWGYGDANTTGTTYAGALGGNANNVRVAIIDTGADLNHPDLQNRAVYGESDLPGTPVTNIGLSFVTDNDGHGTNVAGIAAATGSNNFGFAGVAWAAPLMIFKVFPDPSTCGSGGCTARGSDVGLAIQHAVANGAKVINLSLGSNGPDTAEEAAVATAIASGVVVVAASGNGDSMTTAR
jgi:subtilisin family serine protease